MARRILQTNGRRLQTSRTEQNGMHGALALRMKLFPFAVLSSCLGTLAFLSTDARAQSSVTGILGTVSRCEPPTDSTCVNADAPGENPHPAGVLANALNLEDCAADLHYELQLGISAPSPSYWLEAWVGTQDCSQLTNRQTSATSVCWPVAQAQEALANPFVLDVRMQDIASGAFSPTHPVAYAATTDPSVCERQTQTAATPLTLYMFFVDGASNPVGTVQQYPITFDTRAGNVPGPISVASEDDSVTIAIPPTTDPDTQGYNVYCDPPPGSEAASEPAAATGDAGTGDSGVPSPEGCSASSVFAAPDAGAATGIAAKYLCAQGTATQTSIKVNGLKPGVPYDIAVAATDAVANVGPLSNVACATPSSSPSSSSSAAGGVSCAVENAGSPSGTGGLCAVMAASLVGLARKRRRSSRRHPCG